MQWTEEEAAEVGEAIGIDWEEAEFTPIDLARGMDIETEHGSQHPPSDIGADDPEIAAKIAWAHLLEFPNYYDMLDEMETQLRDFQEREGQAMVTVEVSEFLDPQNWKIVDYLMEAEQAVVLRPHGPTTETVGYFGYVALEGQLAGHLVVLDILLEGYCDNGVVEIDTIEIEQLIPSIMLDHQGKLAPLTDLDAYDLILALDLEPQQC